MGGGGGGGGGVRIVATTAAQVVGARSDDKRKCQSLLKLNGSLTRGTQAAAGLYWTLKHTVSTNSEKFRDVLGSS